MKILNRNYNIFAKICCILVVSVLVYFFANCGTDMTAAGKQESADITVSSAIRADVTDFSREAGRSPVRLRKNNFYGALAYTSENMESALYTDDMRNNAPERKSDFIYADGWARMLYGSIASGFISRRSFLETYAPEVEIPEGDWTGIIVNSQSPLPEGFKVSLSCFKNGLVDNRILEVCKRMFSDAASDGVKLIFAEGYRSMERQNEIFRKAVECMIAREVPIAQAEAKASEIAAPPGTSEHHTGLAVDILTPTYMKMDEGFANTNAYRWLNMFAHNYGFTLRYAKGKANITQAPFEPWHWRFVGAKAATDMKMSGQCMEEYFGVST